MKKLFGLLTFILIGLINFGYCDKVSSLIESISFNGNLFSSYTSVANLSSDLVGKSVCFRINSNGASYSYIQIGFRSVDNGDVSNPIYIYPTTENVYFCLGANIYLRAKIVGGSNGTAIEGDYFNLDGLLDENLPVLTSLQCQTEYNLIPISSVDQNYCLTNGLCPSSPDVECPGSGDNWSALYINNIQHLGKPIINVTIPDYIFWNYETDDDVFNLYVGSGYDVDYINSIVDINSYRPTSDDFTDIFVGGLTLIMPYIVILLFIVFIRKFIKRIFK